MILDKLRKFLTREDKITEQHKADIQKWIDEYNNRMKEKISLKRLEEFMCRLNDYQVHVGQRGFPYFVFKDFMYLIDEMNTKHAIQAVNRMVMFCEWNHFPVPPQLHQIRQIKELKMMEKLERINDDFN